MKCKSLLLSFIFSGTLSIALAQSNQQPVGAAEKQGIIDSICYQLNTKYVFPEVARSMSDLLSANFKKGAYNSINDPVLLSERLTADLQSVSKDKHIRVRLNPDLIKDLKARQTQGAGGNNAGAATQEQWRMNNFGFREVSILEGNIGYIDLRQFVTPQFAGETAMSAMNFVANCNALIIDLRKNGGGSPQMIQLICSYLFDEKPVHLNDFYFRPTNQHNQSWTLAEVKGKRRPDMDVYILTSKSTFSAAEEFTYDLKNLKRATIVGETTGGGANPGSDQILNERFIVFVPTGRAINPVTGTNWEGTGVTPDIATDAGDALSAARQKALEKLAQKDADNAHSIYSWLLTSLKARQNALAIDEGHLKEYAGQYGTKTISLSKGKLLYPMTQLRQVALIPIGEDLFDVEDNLYRIRFVRKNGKVSGIRIEHVNGNMEEYVKDLKSM